MPLEEPSYLYQQYLAGVVSLQEAIPMNAVAVIIGHTGDSLTPTIEYEDGGVVYTGVLGVAETVDDITFVEKA